MKSGKEFYYILQLWDETQVESLSSYLIFSSFLDPPFYLTPSLSHLPSNTIQPFSLPTSILSNPTLLTPPPIPSNQTILSFLLSSYPTETFSLHPTSNLTQPYFLYPPFLPTSLHPVSKLTKPYSLYSPLLSNPTFISPSYLQSNPTLQYHTKSVCTLNAFSQSTIGLIFICCFSLHTAKCFCSV